MEESDKSGKITGSFSGVRQPNGVITGSWASPDGAKSMDFSLFESDKPYEYDPGLLEIERTHRLTPYFIEESHSPSYGYIVKLPAVWKTGEDNSYLGAPTFRSVRPGDNTPDPSKEQITVFSEDEFGDVKEPKEAMNHCLDRLGTFHNAQVDNFQVVKSGEIRSSTSYTPYTATIGTMKTKNIMYVTAGECFMKPLTDEPARRAYHVYVVVCQAEEASYAEYKPLFNAIGEGITFGAAPK